MEALNSPRGLIVDLITPLKADGSIDRPGFIKLLDRVSPCAQALFIAGPGAGEGRNLSREQRSELMETALDSIDGRIPLLFWISRNTEDATFKLLTEFNNILQTRKYGGKVLWVDTPLYYHSNRGLPALYKELVFGTERAFILFNDPELTRSLQKPLKRRNIRTAVLKELVRIDKIAGLIFLGALERSFNYNKACRTRQGFRIYDGDETRFMACPGMGGILSIGANLEPRAWQRIVRSSLRLNGGRDRYPDSLEQTWKTGEYLGNLKDLYRHMPVPVIKGVLSKMGVIESAFCTAPVADTKNHIDQIDELMRIWEEPPAV